MAELADAPDLGSGGIPRAGSSPVIRTILTIITGSRREAAPVAFFCFPHTFRTAIPSRQPKAGSVSLLHLISIRFHNIDFSLIHCIFYRILPFDSADYTPF